MSSNTVLIEKLENERQELLNKLKKLWSFINLNEDEYPAISKAHKKLLNLQYNAMELYLDALETRLELLRYEASN